MSRGFFKGLQAAAKSYIIKVDLKIMKGGDPDGHDGQPI